MLAYSKEKEIVISGDLFYMHTMMKMRCSSYLKSNNSFDDTIPVGISEGKCSIDFRIIKARLKH